MLVLKVILILGIFTVLYTYVGYGILIYGLNKILKKRKVPDPDPNFIPTVTFLVAAFNEEDCIEEKILNTLSLDYPPDKIDFLFVTDGSSDGTNDIIGKYPAIKCIFEPERKGKIAATKRAMKGVDTDIVIFSDANTQVNEPAIREIVKHFRDPRVGGVACEKKVRIRESDNATASGEGIYWKYESFLKKQDSSFCSVVGAAGELFAIRTELFEQVPSDTIIEDFYLTLRIAEKGFAVRYEPGAYAIEDPSYSISEENKRKTRIAAGGIQAIIRLRSLLNPFRSPRLSFVYVSHRVLRWTITPFLLPIIFVISTYLYQQGSFYAGILTYLQVLFYFLAFCGYLLRNKKLKTKIFYVPFYFTFMNYAVFAGMFRYFSGQQSVVWEKSKRAGTSP